MPNNRNKVADRFWSKVEVANAADCWVWTAALRNKRYGCFRVVSNKSMQQAHRVAWTLVVGPIPTGLCILHRCDNPRCVNPDHLFLGTQRDNIRDMDQKDRRNVERRIWGEKHHSAKLTDRQVIQIRNLSKQSGFNQHHAARQFGVSQSVISMIVNHKRRKSEATK